MSRNPPHIIQVTPNKKGRIRVIGDPHGSNEGFCAVLKTLRPEDSLYCPGDLFDRRDGNIELFRALQAQNKGKNPQQVYITRGNHEEMLLKTIEAVDHFLQGKLTETDANHFLRHLNCGSAWIFTEARESVEICYTDFEDEIKILLRNMKKQLPAAKAITERKIQETKLRYAQKILTDHHHMLVEHSLLHEMKTLIESLPYIIFFGNFNAKHDAFLIVHADMPISDSELEERLIGHNGKTPMLTEAEIKHALWARVDSHEHTTLDAPVRNHNSILALVGHDMIDTLRIKYDRETNFTELNVVRRIRRDTNTINLDGAAYAEQEVFLVLEFTEGNVSLVGPEDVDISIHPSVAAAKEMTTYLQSQRQAAKHMNQLKKMNGVLSQYLTTLETQSALLEGGLFSPKHRTNEITVVRYMQIEIARLLRDNLTEHTQWNPPIACSQAIRVMCEELQQLRKQHHDSWVLVEKTMRTYV